MAYAVVGLNAFGSASEFGPSDWTLQNWEGVGLSAAAFFILLLLILRAAEPSVLATRDTDLSGSRENLSDES
jgi:hypothetical protein